MINALLIDDEKSALNNLERMLKDYEDINVIGAYTNVYEGLEKFLSEKIHLVFLDMEMPMMKGVEVAKRILEIDTSVKVVFVTAYDDYAIDAFDLGAVDYLLKPIVKRRLDKTIKRLVTNDNLFKHEQENQKIEVLCFGNFEIKNGEEVIKWRTAKAEELIALLVHYRGEFVHKDIILDGLWPNKNEDQANKLFHTTMYYARNGLKSMNLHKAIQYSNKMYRFNMENVYCDIEEFGSIVIENTEMSPERIERLKEGTGLYKGDYLQNKDYRWSDNEKKKLANDYIDVLIRLADYYADQGVYSKAIPFLKKVIEKDYYMESVHRKILSAYIFMEDTYNYKRHYDELVFAFQRELNIELSQGTQDLYMEGLKTLKANF